MKKAYTSFCSFILCIFIFFAIFYPVLPVCRADGEPETYIVQAVDGLVMVFDHSGTPICETEILISTLRGSDIARLEKGIMVTGKTSLLKLLEDFSS